MLNCEEEIKKRNERVDSLQAIGMEQVKGILKNPVLETEGLSKEDLICIIMTAEFGSNWHTFA